ncbi:MAG: hypothetical protein JXB26_20515 [Candidatus Aminicenantes bacterium]|nr:hypothetical protein [Candidatus Aminicenantes bacterium]
MKKHRIFKGFIPAFIIAALFFISCAKIRKPYVIPSVIKQDISTISVEDFPSFIHQLEDLARSHPDISIRLEARLTIALICVHTDNPYPDYERAMHNLNEYVTLSPNGEDKTEIKIWMSVLARLDESIEENEKLQAEARDLDQKNRVLNSRFSRQKKLIKFLEEKIQKLDSIFLEIENKRKKKK